MASHAAPLLPTSRDRQIGIVKAAWKLEDALNDRLVEDYPSDLQARELHFKCEQASIDNNRALIALVLLSLLELPPWCDQGSDSGWAWPDPDKLCTIPNVKQEEILLSHLPYLPVKLGLLLEVVLVLVVGRKLLLDRALQVQHFARLNITYHDLWVSTFGLACCLLEFADCFVYATIRPKFRLAFIARTGYLLVLPPIRQLARCISAVIGEFLSIAAFYAGTVASFAWVAVVMFGSWDDRLKDGSPVNKGFDALRTSLNTMFVAGSTDDLVECFLPTYTAFRPSGLLWFGFLVIARVLLLNLVLDTLVAAYSRYAEGEEEKNSMEAVDGIRQAFDTVNSVTGENDTMTRETFLSFIRELSRSPSMRNIPEKNADIIFRGVDKDSSGEIDSSEFFDICGLIQYDFWTTKTDSLVKDHIPSLWNAPWFISLREKVTSGVFDTLMNWVLLVNFVLVVWESEYDLNDWPEPVWMENLELGFAFIYVFEVGVKLCVWDFSFYWSTRANIFDFVTTWMLLASAVIDELVEGSTNAKRYVNALRLLRLLRVLKQLRGIRKVQLMVETIVAIVCASKHIMLLLGVVTFFFSSLSVQLWGGLMYESNPNLEETEYKEKDMFVLNFNDFANAFGVWVVSLLCEYIPLFPDAISRVSFSGAWLVFLFFYIVGASIVFELVKAFTIEAFLELHRKWGQKELKFETLTELEHAFAESGLHLHCREVGDPNVHEKIMKALEEMHECHHK